MHWLDSRFPAHYYPGVLKSYALWRTSKKPSYMGPDAIVLGDSGGYEVVTKGSNFDPESVLLWQANHCTRGLMLDIPPYRPGSNVQFSGSAADYFHESLARAVMSVIRAERVYKDLLSTGSPFRWWGVVQGETFQQMVEWHRSISDIYPFSAPDEGWAAAPKPSTDIIASTRYLRFMKEVGIRNVHFLQITKPRTVAVLLALAQMSGSFDLVTYDSATQTRTAINRMIIYDRGVEIEFFKEVGDEAPTLRAYMGNECHCPGCLYYKEHAPIPARHLWKYLLLHNVLVLRDVFDRIFLSVKRDPEGLLRWGAGEFYGEVLREWNGTNHNTGKSVRVVSLLERL